MKGLGAAVKEQYERLPYPPVPWLALPRVKDALRLASSFAGTPKRILVAGAGTLEACVVATAFPSAEQIVAVDLSSASLRVLDRRLRFMRVARFYRPAPRVEMLATDLFEWSPEAPFDLVFATNVVHHTERPHDLLLRLASFLRPGGRLRLVTYPRGSRLWIREVGRYLRSEGIRANDEDVVRHARHACGKLREGDPVRSAYESHPEKDTREGLVDAFFHACELPLWPADWKKVSEAAGLSLLAEDQNEASRSSFLDSLVPEARDLGPWEKLDVLDAALELATNPVLWFEKREASGAASRVRPSPLGAASDAWWGELREGIARVDAALLPLGSSTEKLAAAIEREVGPRSTGTRTYPGLTLGEYSIDAIRTGAAKTRADILRRR